MFVDKRYEKKHDRIAGDKKKNILCRCYARRIRKRQIFIYLLTSNNIFEIVMFIISSNLPPIGFQSDRFESIRVFERVLCKVKKERKKEKKSNLSNRFFISFEVVSIINLFCRINPCFTPRGIDGSVESERIQDH